MIAMRTRSLAVLMVTAVLAAFGAVASLAQAAVTPGDNPDYTFDFQDPIHTGCADDAETVGQTAIHDSRGNQLGYVELRWSPSCQTNWARVTSTSGPIFTPERDMTVEIKRRSDGAYERVGVGDQDFAFDPGSDADYQGFGVGNYQGAKSLYTDMLYSPGPAQAIGTLDVSTATISQP
jgi:Protein of unknown function (DUF2690)